MASAPTWWLDMTSPSFDTNDPEPPLLNRTDDFWMCSSQASVGSKPYFSFSNLRGGSLKSHMPSSASIIGVLNMRSAAASDREIDFPGSKDFTFTSKGEGG